MAASEAEIWRKARQAREQLENQFLRHPDITMIDIGFDPKASDPVTDGPIVLRVHVKRSTAVETLQLPTEVQGLPVRVIFADYGLQ